MISLRDWATREGVSMATAARLAREGRIGAKKLGSGWAVPESQGKPVRLKPGPRPDFSLLAKEGG